MCCLQLRSDELWDSQANLGFQCMGCRGRAGLRPFGAPRHMHLEPLDRMRLQRDRGASMLVGACKKYKAGCSSKNPLCTFPRAWVALLQGWTSHKPVECRELGRPWTQVPLGTGLLGLMDKVALCRSCILMDFKRRVWYVSWPSSVPTPTRLFY